MKSKSATLSDYSCKFKIGRFWFLLSIAIVLFFPACNGEESRKPEEIDAVSLVGIDSRYALSEPSWAPGGDLLTVTANSLCGLENCESQVFTLNVSTKELLPLGEKGLTGGAWTFFGNEISVVNPTLSKIYTVSGIGGIPQLMADGNGIVWSRDGKYAAIVKTINESEFGLTRSGVFIHERDSSDEGLLIFETPESLENEITGSAWSFDHSKLAISARWSAGSGDKSAVFIVNMNGHGSRQLAENIEQPGWINGNWLFFIKENKLGFAPLYYQCEMMLDEFEGLEGLEGLRNPTISPSGNKIAFEHDSKIYLLDLSEIPGQLTCDE